MDELSLSGENHVAEVRAAEITYRTLTPEDAGLRRSQAALPGGDEHINADILRSIFAGEQGAPRDTVLFNAAAVLLVAGLASTLEQGVQQAAHALDSGRVTLLLQQLQTSQR